MIKLTESFDRHQVKNLGQISNAWLNLQLSHATTFDRVASFLLLYLFAARGHKLEGEQNNSIWRARHFETLRHKILFIQLIYFDWQCCISPKISCHFYLCALFMNQSKALLELSVYAPSILWIKKFKNVRNWSIVLWSRKKSLRNWPVI